MTRTGATLFDLDKTPSARRRAPAGVTTSDLAFSAYVGTNAEVFPHVVRLHVPEGSRVADVTFGQGVFWRNVPPHAYTLVPSDIQTGIDCRALPYRNGSFDCVVLDPPYMEGLFRRARSHLAGAGSHAAFRDYYSNGEETHGGPKYPQVVHAHDPAVMAG